MLSSIYRNDMSSDWRRHKDYNRYDFTDENSAAEFAEAEGGGNNLLSYSPCNDALHNLNDDCPDDEQLHEISDDDDETNGTTTTGAVKIPKSRPPVPSNPEYARKPRKRSSSRSKAAVSSIRAALDVCIQVGGEVFWQSSAILQYASPVLVQHLTVIDDDSSLRDASHANATTTYLLRIPHCPSLEWRLLEPFLQPHSRQAAVMTPKHLILLRWFLDLDLQVLLQQSDDILSQLHWNPQCDSLQVLLTWSCIAKAAHLPKTSRQVWLAWQRALAEVQQPTSSVENAPGDVVVCMLGADISCLQLFLELLAEWPEARHNLWLALMRYLPADLEMYTDHENLLRNPLLPFLLREGLVRAAEDENRKRRGARRLALRSSARSVTEPNSPPTVSVSPSMASTTLSSKLSKTDIDVDAAAANCKETSPLHQRTLHNDLPSSAPATEDWQTTVQSSVQELLSWLVPSGDDESSSSTHRTLPPVCPSNSYCPEALASGINLEASSPQAELLAQIPNNRMEWLEMIWQKLSGPPILSPLPLPEDFNTGETISQDDGSPQRQSRIVLAPTPPRRKPSDSTLSNTTARKSRSKGSRAAEPRTRPVQDVSFSTGTTASGASSTGSSQSVHSRSSTSGSRESITRDSSTAPSVASASFHDTEDSTLSTCPHSMLDESSVGIVRASTRTFYC